MNNTYEIKLKTTFINCNLKITKRNWTIHATTCYSNAYSINSSTTKAKKSVRKKAQTHNRKSKTLFVNPINVTLRQSKKKKHNCVCGERAFSQCLHDFCAEQPTKPFATIQCEYVLVGVRFLCAKIITITTKLQKKPHGPNTSTKAKQV